MSQTGKALIYDPQGVDSLLYCSQNPVPVVVGKKEILIKVLAAGLNPVDYKLPLMMPMRLLKGKPVGQDVCGTVVKVGKKVADFAEGDLVCGFGGGLSEYTIVSSGEVIKVPEGVSSEVAGCVGVAGLTAYQMLKKNGAFEGSDAKKILVIGASGGVGSLVVQIAKALCPSGSVIYGMCSSRSADFVKGLGADELVDYTATGFSLAKAIPVGSLDLVADCVTSPEDPNYVPEGMQLIKPKTGKYVAINTASKFDWMRCIFGNMMGFNLFRGKYSLLLCEHKPADLQAVTELIAQGKLKIHIHAKPAFTEDNVRNSYSELKARRVHGKIVVVM